MRIGFVRFYRSILDSLSLSLSLSIYAIFLPVTEHIIAPRLSSHSRSTLVWYFAGAEEDEAQQAATVLVSQVTVCLVWVSFSSSSNVSSHIQSSLFLLFFSLCCSLSAMFGSAAVFWGFGLFLPFPPSHRLISLYSLFDARKALKEKGYISIEHFLLLLLLLLLLLFNKGTTSQIWSYIRLKIRIWT